MKTCPTSSLLALLLMLFSLNAAAVSREEFDKERFDALTRDNALILVDIFANWSPTVTVHSTALYPPLFPAR